MPKKLTLGASMNSLKDYLKVMLRFLAINLRELVVYPKV